MVVCALVCRCYVNRSYQPHWPLWPIAELWLWLWSSGYHVKFGLKRRNGQRRIILQKKTTIADLNVYATSYRENVLVNFPKKCTKSFCSLSYISWFIPVTGLCGCLCIGLLGWFHVHVSMHTFVIIFCHSCNWCCWFTWTYQVAFTVVWWKFFINLRTI